MLFYFVNYFTLGDCEFAGLEVGAGSGGVFGSFCGESGEGIVNPEELFCGLEEFCEEDRSVAFITAELDEVAVFHQHMLGAAKEFGGFLRGDLVVHERYYNMVFWKDIESSLAILFTLFLKSHLFQLI